jgi:hypothetical protein
MGQSFLVFSILGEVLPKINTWLSMHSGNKIEDQNCGWMDLRSEITCCASQGRDFDVGMHKEGFCWSSFSLKKIDA